jgi:hypothetical protein
MKICCRCGVEKTEDDFAVRRGSLQPYCKQCNREYLRNHYQKNKQYYLDKARAGQLRTQRMVYEYLSTHPCERCGESRVPCLQFDHINPAEKQFGISNSWLKYGWTRVLEEIQKCRVLCANCHAVWTAEQFGWYNLVLDGE